MARVIFHTPAGVQSYKAHMSFNVTPDPYPNGVTVYEGGEAQDIPRIVNSSYVRIRASELGAFDAGHGYKVNFEWSGATSGSNYFSSASGSDIYIPVGSKNTSLTEVYCWADGSSPTQNYKYNVHFFGNGGTSGGQDSVYDPSQYSYYTSDTASPNYDLSGAPVFSKTGSYFVGWAYGATPSTGETVYTDTISLEATTSGKTNNIHAVWKDYYKYRIHAYGNGGTSSGDADIYYPTETGWELDESLTPSFPLARLPAFTRDGYTLVGWAAGKDPVQGEAVFKTDIPVAATASGYTNNIHAVWKETVPKFYWHGSDDADNGKFYTGGNIAAAITAAAWNRLQDTVYDLFSASGAAGSYTRQTAQPSGTIYAFQYNNTRAGLTAIKGAISGSTVQIPDEVYGENDTQHTPTTIIPSQWNGETTGFSPVASLKSALNHLIEDWS